MADVMHVKLSPLPHLPIQRYCQLHTIVQVLRALAHINLVSAEGGFMAGDRLSPAVPI